MVKHQLRGMLERANLSERSLSERSGVSRQVIRDILNGQTRNPRPETTRKIARELGIPVAEFRDELEKALKPRRSPK